MPTINEDSNTQTSTLKIYNILKNSEHPLLKLFNIDFPAEGCLDSNSNMILVAESSEEYNTSSNKTDHYKVLTEIFIKTKKMNYKETSELLRTTVRVIKNILKADESLSWMNPVFRNSACKYKGRYELKSRNLLIQTDEVDNLDYGEDIDYTVLFGGVEVNGEEE